ncbi:3-hydroxyacyl-ACP dehydratase FabZ [Buchnera aphidicola]|uniref:3-hydroxyacyl-ACP dehydratase FabZ n=1 Tax=Buchnera aphidicola TaxID=9 RepID=UPI003464100E
MKKINFTDIENIFNLLPHRYPFFLIDRVLKIKKSEFIYVVKNVSFNEPFFQGHFPGKPIFPGVLILESMIQASGLLGLKSFSNLPLNSIYYLVAIDRVRFKKIVIPGDQIFIEVFIEKSKSVLTRFKSLAKVDDKIVCTAIITCMLKKY